MVQLHLWINFIAREVDHHSLVKFLLISICCSLLLKFGLFFIYFCLFLISDGGMRA